MLQHFQWGRKNLALPTNWPAECCIWPISRKVWLPALLVCLASTIMFKANLRGSPCSRLQTFSRARKRSCCSTFNEAEKTLRYRPTGQRNAAYDPLVERSEFACLFRPCTSLWLTISPSRSVTRYQHSARELYSLWCPAKDSLPGGVIILLVALCYRIRNKLRQQTCVLWSENWSKTPVSCFSITPEHGYLPCIIFNRTNTRSRTWPRKRWAPSDVG